VFVIKFLFQEISLPKILDSSICVQKLWKDRIGRKERKIAGNRGEREAGRTERKENESLISLWLGNIN
jgi:hypothetical protein